MSTVYTNDLRLKEIGTGLESGTWGTSTNTNLSLIAEAFSYQTEATFTADSNFTGSDAAIIADGTTDKYRAMYVKVTSTTNLTATRTLEIGPNTCSKIIFIENATSGNQVITVKQGSGATVNVNNGKAKLLLLEGTGASAGVIDALDKIDLGANATINGGEFGITANETATFTNKTINSANNTITNIDNGDISATAQIDATKIADGSVTSAEFQHINTLSSNAQTQINSKLNSALPNDAWISSADGRERLYFTTNANTVMKYDTQWRVDNNAGSTRLSCDAAGNFTATGNVGAYSDMALKEDIYQIENALDKVNQLRGVHFTRKLNNSKEIGVVANEVEKVVPELVDEYEDEELGKIKTMKYANTVGLLIEAVKDVSKQVEELKNGSSK